KAQCGSCCSPDDIDDARAVAQALGIPFYVAGVEELFKDRVVNPFVQSYLGGRTPIPCVACNRSIKFEALLERARAYGADVLATGHYARTALRDGRYRLQRAVQPGKDQSYVLYMLGQQELQMARFPVGDYPKEQIRQIAESLDLRTAHKPESQDLCFVPGGDSHAYLSENVPQGSVAGPIVDPDGRRLGTHKGFAHYTIGQRKGLGISAGLPLYVKEVRAGENTVVVAGAEHLKVGSIQLDKVSFVAGAPTELRATVMTRYRGGEAPATVKVDGTTALVEFDEEQARPAPGQAAVFYDGDEVLGGGTIRPVE
ncbi:MAG: tRNA 2-thiouridine(34) synthase MnmA, partial [Actinobacteria bacterium]|nr:tRNA 2-thiouridine(34) synthase MnmA [Actinomycetota bacterium]